MGFIKAFTGALGGTFADQWKDFIVPEAAPATAAIFGAVKKGTDAGRGSNTKGSENIITNGSKIVVPEGCALITMQDGAITGCITEVGGFIYNSDDQNSQSFLAGDGFISSTLKLAPIPAPIACTIVFNSSVLEDAKSVFLVTKSKRYLIS